MRRLGESFARAFSVAIPALAAGVLSSLGPLAAHGWWLWGGALGLSAFLATRAGERLTSELHLISDVLAGYREGNFSVRARARRGHDPLGELIGEVNRLGEALRDHRLGELEVWTLLRKMMAELDVVVLAFDASGHVKLANERAVQVLKAPLDGIVGQTASRLGLEELVTGAAPRVIESSASLGAGLWQLRRGSFRLGGEPHVLALLSDISSVLQQEELEAWKRLIRVMGHEINNSLAPIQSVATSSLMVLAKTERPEDWERDLASGLSIVARRAEGLGRFITGYAKLAQLPAPVLEPVDVADWVARCAALERRVSVHIAGGPAVSVPADADQLDQLLINLLKNAAEASLEPGASVRVQWSLSHPVVTLWVDDDGPGAPDSANLFVPFFTTKPDGSGIGLVLARQIARAHGGDLRLVTRERGSGARAVVRLPLLREEGAP